MGRARGPGRCRTGLLRRRRPNSRIPSAASGATEIQVLEAYRRAWCLARPQCLFLAVGEELRVYSLSQPPARSAAARLTALEVVRRASNVAEVLQAFRREHLESGAPFERADWPGATSAELATVSGVRRNTLYGLLARLVKEGALQTQSLPTGRTGYALSKPAARESSSPAVVADESAAADEQAAAATPPTT